MIYSRGKDEDNSIGDGEIVLNLTTLQAELIAAMLASIALGNRPYQEAAYDLMTAFEESFGEDFIRYSCETIQPQYLVLDQQSLNVIETFDFDQIIVNV